MSKVYAADRLARLAQISTKFHAHAMVGDEILLGIEGDDQMPTRYRGGARPTGTIVKVKNEGTEQSTLRVQMDSGRMVDLHPYSVAGDRVWEFSDRSWSKVLARSNPEVAEKTYRGSSGSSGNDDLASMRKQMNDMAQRFDQEMAEAKNFNNALVESIHAISNDIRKVDPNAKFASTFATEYAGMRKTREVSPFDSDMESGDEM